MKARLFFTADSSSFVSRRVCALTGGDFSHVGIVFYKETAPAEYFEAWHKKEGAGKNGLRGPLPLEKLARWQIEKPGARRFELMPANGFLPITEAEAVYMRLELMAARNRVKYAGLQILQNLVALRLGLQISLRRGGAAKWTCSETVIRCLPARLWKYFDIPTYSAAFIAPSGPRLPSIDAGLLRLFRAHKPTR